MVNTVEQDQVGSAVFITKSSYMINTVEQDRTRSRSSVIRVCSVYNKVVLYD